MNSTIISFTISQFQQFAFEPVREKAERMVVQIATELRHEEANFV